MFQKNKSFTRSGKLGGAVVLAMAFSLSFGFGQIYMDTNDTTAGFGDLNGATWNTAGTNWTTNAAGTSSTVAWDNSSGTTVFDTSGGGIAAVTLGNDFTVSGLTLTGTNLSFAATGTHTLTVNGTVQVAASQTLNFGGLKDVWSTGITGDFTKTGAGRLALSSTAISGVLGTSTITIQEGIFEIRNSSVKSSSTRIVMDGGTLYTSSSNAGFNLASLSGSSGSLTFLGHTTDSTIGVTGAAGEVFGAAILKRPSGTGLISLTHSGTGLWTLTGTGSTYNGVTTVAGGGTLEVAKLANGGVASSIGESTNVAGNLLLGDGTTFRYIGAGDSTDRLFTINGTFNGHSATLESSGSGAVAFTNTGALGFGDIDETRALILGGTNTGNNVLAATLTNNGTAALSLTKNNAGKWSLSGNNTYTGLTQVNGGTLLIAGTGSINSSSSVEISSGGNFSYSSSTGLSRDVTLNSGGTFTHNGANNYTGSLTWNGGTLAGTNFSGVNLTVGTGKTLSPGNSPGTMTSGNQTWLDGGNYNLQVHDANGLAGTGFDTLSITGTLDLTAVGAEAFNINLWSLSAIGPDVNGNAINFDSGGDYSWLIATTTGGITGFDSGTSQFKVNTGAVNGTNGFTNSLGGGTFSVTNVGNNLYLEFGAIPEPGTLGLALLAGGLLCLRRRRKD